MGKRATALLAGVMVALALPLPWQAGAAPEPTSTSYALHFSNVTAQTGLGAPGSVLSPDQVIVEDNAAFLNGGKGAAWLDYDADGWEDILIGGWHTRSLHHNNGDGTFTDVTASAGIAGTAYLMGVLAPDINNDGYPDIVFAVWYGPLEIWMNKGDGTFVNVTRPWGLYILGPTAGVSFGDLDGDGCGDLYFGSYYRHANILLHNIEGRGFVEVTDQAGVADVNAYTFQTLIFDYDHDGDLDLYDVNDFGPDALFRNDGGLNFTDVTAATGLNMKGDGMGGALGDLNNDGWMDVFVTNFAEDHWLVYDPVAGAFNESLLATRITDRNVGWGVNIQDFDNDGYPDVFIADGRVISSQQPEPDTLWHNLGNGTFADIAGTAGVADPGINRGSAVADFDKDGKLDLWVSNVVANSTAYRNDGSAGNWLQVKLEGVLSGRDAVGARVVATVLGHPQTRYVHMGSSYLSQDSVVQHFGIGSAVEVDDLTVTWPSGVVQTFTNVSANQRLTIREFEPNPPVVRAADVVEEAGDEVTFSSQGTTDDSKIASWRWTFTGPYSGVVLTGPSPTHNFYDPGIFTGTLTVTDAFGNVGIANFNVTIVSVAHPLVYAGPDVQGPEGSSFTFNATLKGTLPPDAYNTTLFTWTMVGPVTNLTFTGRQFSYTFALPGVFTVTVNATDQFDNVGTDSLSARIIDTQPPVIVFTPPAQDPEDVRFALDASATTDNDPLFESTGLFVWRMEGPGGQHEVRDGVVVDFTLRDPGVNRFKLEVNDSSGNFAELDFEVLALDLTPPIAEGGSDRVVRAGSMILLDASGSQDNDPTLMAGGLFQWTYAAPDGPGVALGVQASIPVNVPGSTIVRLHVVDPSGNPCARDDVFTITALDRTNPQVAPQPDREATVGVPVIFDAGPVVDNDPVFPAGSTFRWSLVDGQFRAVLEGPVVNYTYKTPGRFQATLTVADAAGNSVLQSFLVSTFDRMAPLIDATVPGTSVEGDAVILDAEASTDDVGISSFIWLIEGPTPPISVNGPYVRWTCTLAGDYNITLTLSDTAGNIVMKRFTIIVSSADGALPEPEQPPNPSCKCDSPSNSIATYIAGVAIAAGAACALALIVMRRRRRGQP